MTTLTLQAVSLNAQQLTRPLRAVFDDAGGSIGRADHNTLALPDPERHISRMQAQIRRVADGYAIDNVGSATPIVVAGRTLARGESAAVSDGAQIVIGGYLLEAVVSDGATTPRPKRPIVHAPSANDPFADLHTPAPRGSGAREAPVAEASDPFAALQSAGAPPGRASVASPFDGLLDAAAAPSIDAMFGLQGDAVGALDGFVRGDDAPRAAGRADAVSTAADHTPLLRGAYVPPPPSVPGAPVVGAALIPNDATWLRLGDRPTPAAQPPAARRQAPAAPPPTAPEERVGAGSDVGVDVAAVAPPAARRDTAPTGADGVAAPELHAAFCDGAGLQANRVPAIDAGQMRLVGGVLRAAVEGTLQLVALRATTKHELRAQVTVIQSRDNNPLKFSPDAEGALEQLLQPAVRGFMSAPAAMQDAMGDLLGHAIGTMAGTRSALDGLLEQFAPQALEHAATPPGLLDRLWPSRRGARHWTRYCAQYAALRNEVANDFHALFGRAFLAAYEQQVQRLVDAPAARHG